MTAKTGQLSAVLHQVGMPMRRKFGHARATRDASQSVVLRIDVDGVEGVGEGVPRDYVTGETPESAFQAIARLDLAELVGAVDFGSFEAAVRGIEALDLPGRLRQQDRLGLAAGCCVELALLDAVGKRFGRSIRDTAQALSLPAALTAGAGETHPLSRALDGSASPEAIVTGPFRERFRVLKIKVGLGPEADVARIRAARELVGEAFTVVVDGNMAWSLDEACRMVDAFRPFSIGWYEEPLAQYALKDYRVLRERTGARIMLDESLCSFADGQAAIAEQACDLFNVRLSKCGGFLPSLRLAELAQRHSIEVMMGTHPGAQGILRAAEWNFAHTVAGIVSLEAAISNTWYEQELIRERLEVDSARRRLVPLDGPGLGITLEIEPLERFTERRAVMTSGCWTAQG
jgi:muconate cycloisomerase